MKVNTYLSYHAGNHQPEVGGIPYGDEYLEYGVGEYSSAGIEFILVNQYTEEPVVTASIAGTPTDLGGSAFTLVIESVDSGSGYSRVRITPSGTVVPSGIKARIMMLALCKGKITDGGEG